MTNHAIEWFESLTDEQLIHAALTESIRTQDDPQLARELLVALVQRLKPYTSDALLGEVNTVLDEVRELQEKIKNSHDPNDGSDGL